MIKNRPWKRYFVDKLFFQQYLESLLLILVVLYGFKSKQMSTSTSTQHKPHCKLRGVHLIHSFISDHLYSQTSYIPYTWTA